MNNLALLAKSNPVLI